MNSLGLFFHSQICFLDNFNIFSDMPKPGTYQLSQITFANNTGSLLALTTTTSPLFFTNITIVNHKANDSIIKIQALQSTNFQNLQVSNSNSTNGVINMQTSACVSIKDSLFDNNSGSLSNVILINNTNYNVSISNLTFKNNFGSSTATIENSAFYLSNSVVNITNCNFSSNNGLNGGALRGTTMSTLNIDTTVFTSLKIIFFNIL